GGGAFALLMRFRSALPEGLANVAALASAVVIFQISNAITPESGITAAILAGMVVGHTRSYELNELREFKEQLTVLLVATLFVLLTADVRLAEIRVLGWPGVLTVLALILVVRPVNVFCSTFRTDLELREKLFLSWLAPRGIVAAAVSSLFAQRMADAGLEGGGAIRALVFLVIAMTVLVQGMSAGLVASVLGVRVPREVGFVILGANEAARCLGAVLATAGEEVVFIDTNADSARAAEEAGFKVVFGDGLDDRALIKARVQTRRGCISATPNESVNFLFAKKVHDRAKGVATYVAIERKEAGVSTSMVRQNRSRLLFAGAHELAQWSTAKRHFFAAKWTALSDTPTDAPSFDDLPAGIALPLALVRANIASPVERPYHAKKGDVIHLAIATEQTEEAEGWLSQNGWAKES
ncbi:MAG: cation:proton antiporter, partial [Polyangiaceae bacterium]